MPQSSSERDPVDLLAEEFALRCRRGEQPSVAEYVQRFPHLAEQIRVVLPSVAMMEQAKRRKPPMPTAPTARLKRIGDFEILREIGRGGMGVVYEARQQSLGRRVALKVLPNTALADGNKLARFQREAQAAARLHHTNIVPVFGVGHAEGLHYYVMQCIDGRGLDKVLAELRSHHSQRETRGPGEPTPETLDLRGGRNGGWPGDASEPVSDVVLRNSGSAASGDHSAATSSTVKLPRGQQHWRFVAQVGLQVATALQYAHEQGVLHRDIKPANLILDQHETAWITDFGLAKLLEHDNLTRTGDIVGTLQYLAPETLKGKADVRSDIYSLGLTLYELLTLQSPYGDSNPARLLEQISQRTPVAPRKLVASVPRDLETIVLKAIAREPEHRYATAGALAADLQRYLQDRPIEARPTAAVERLWRWCRRNPVTAGLSATSLCSLLLAAIVGWSGYANTRAALAQVSVKRDEAVKAKQRADANVELSLAALEDIFHQLARRESDRPDEPGGFAGPRRRGPREEDEARDNTALLESIISFYHRFAEQNKTSASLQREAAKANRRIGELQQQLGHDTEADAAYRRAQGLYQALLAENGADPNLRYDLATTDLMLAGDTANSPAKDAAAQLQQARLLADQLIHDDSRPTQYQDLSALVDLGLAETSEAARDNGAAEKYFRKGIATREQLARRFPRSSLDAEELGHARSDLAKFLMRHDRAAEAEALLTMSTSALAEAEDGPRGSRRLHDLLRAQYLLLHDLFEKQGKTTEAEAIAAKSEAIARRGREGAPGRRDDGPPEAREPRPRDDGPPDPRDGPPRDGPPGRGGPPGRDGEHRDPEHRPLGERGPGGGPGAGPGGPRERFGPSDGPGEDDGPPHKRPPNGGPRGAQGQDRPGKSPGGGNDRPPPRGPGLGPLPAKGG